jgi:hypothetical protein
MRKVKRVRSRDTPERVHCIGGVSEIASRKVCRQTRVRGMEKRVQGHSIHHGLRKSLSEQKS